MSSYTRHQLLVLLTITFVAGAGLAVGQWRRLHPDAVDRIERLDRAPVSEGERSPGEPSPDTPAPRPARRSKISPVPGVTPPAPPAPPPAKKVDGPPLDLNSAPVDALTRLPGVGPVLAARIADGRPYATVDDLRRVRGVGRAKLERFREMVTIAER